jgi:hypothetical protein
VRVFLIADAVHDVSLFELRHVVTIQASQQAMATPLPPEVADREYDNRGWGVNIVACIARAAKRACEEGRDSAAVSLEAPLVSICKHASAELVLVLVLGGGCGGAPRPDDQLEAPQRPHEDLRMRAGGHF